MNWYATIIFLAIAAQQHSSVLPLECVTTEPAITRIFNSLDEYQLNIIDFIPTKAGFKGNHVEFRFDTIDHLIKDIFETYDSEHVIKLNLTHKAIKRIDEGSFLGLDCLHILDLSNNKITNLSEGIFEGLGRLRELDLSHNYLRNISAYQFRNLTDLTSLDLSSNMIILIEDEAFFDLSSMATLNLERNFLKTLPPSLHYLTSLIELKLQSNDIKFPQITNLKSVSQTIITLDLSQNSIERINYTANFTFPHMTFWNLSHNSLKRLDVYSIHLKFPSLVQIDVNYNFWDCHVLFSIKEGLSNAHIVPVGNNGTANSIICNDHFPHTYPVMPKIISSVSQNFSDQTVLMEIFDTVSVNKQISDNLELKVYKITNIVVIIMVICIIFLVLILNRRSDYSENFIDWSRIPKCNRRLLSRSPREYIEL